MKFWFAICTALVLVGCGGTPDRYAVTAIPVERSVRISLSSVELRNLTLPAYAAADEIPSEDATGKLVSDGAALWADAPERAVGLELSRHLMAVTGARIAPSPWPFESLPQGSLDLRFETMLARADGSFQVSGQYFLGRLEGGRERSGVFDLSVPIAQPATPVTIANARGAAIAKLAGLLAREALR